MSQQRIDAAKLIAGCMMSHFDCPIDSFSEFFSSDEGPIDGVTPDRIDEAEQYVNETVTKDTYGDTPENIAFRKEVLEQIKQNLKL